MQNIIHDHHNLDALILAVHDHPTENIIQRLIDKEIAPDGTHQEIQFCRYLWAKTVKQN